MKKNIVTLLISALAAFTLTACGSSEVVHCDSCGIEIKLPSDSNANEDWTVYCDDCSERLGLDKLP